VSLLQQALGNKCQRADALVVACAVIDDALRQRYAADNFNSRVDRANRDGPLEQPNMIKAAWVLRNKLAHQAAIPGNRQICEAVRDIASEHLRLTGDWTRALEMRLSCIADSANSVTSADVEYQVPLVDAVHELVIPAASDEPDERAVALLLAAGLLERHIEQRAKSDADFPATEPFRARLEYALSVWLDRCVGVTEERAIEMRNSYAHEARHPGRGVVDEVILLVELTDEIAEQIDDPPSPPPPPPDVVTVSTGLYGYGVEPRIGTGERISQSLRANIGCVALLLVAPCLAYAISVEWPEIVSAHEDYYQGLLRGNEAGAHCSPKTPCKWSDIPFSRVPAFIPALEYLLLLVVVALAAILAVLLRTVVASFVLLGGLGVVWLSVRVVRGRPHLGFVRALGDLPGLRSGYSLVGGAALLVLGLAIYFGQTDRADSLTSVVKQARDRRMTVAGFVRVVVDKKDIMPNLELRANLDGKEYREKCSTWWYDPTCTLGIGPQTVKAGATLEVTVGEGMLWQSTLFERSFVVPSDERSLTASGTTDGCHTNVSVDATAGGR